MNARDFWKKYEFALNETVRFRAGYMEVRVRRIRDAWLIQSFDQIQHFPELIAEKVEGLRDELNTFHFQTGKSNDLIVLPAFPVKPVVFRNNESIRISAGESAHLFLNIPLSIQFYFQEVKEENRMFEIQMQRLSDTWFGEPDNGEPAFSIGSAYHTEFEEVKSHPWEAISPVEIINSTTGLLDLQRLILRVEDFSLYLKGKHLLSNCVAIEFKGQEYTGNVNLSVQKNIQGEKPTIISKPRSLETKNLLRRSFFFIKNMYQN